MNFSLRFFFYFFFFFWFMNKYFCQLEMLFHCYVELIVAVGSYREYCLLFHSSFHFSTNDQNKKKGKKITTTVLYLHISWKMVIKTKLECALAA